MKPARMVMNAVRDGMTFGPAIYLRGVLPRDRHGATSVRTRKGRFYTRPGDSDMDVLRQVFALREYDLRKFPQFQRINDDYLDCVAEGRTPVIVDAGANIGAASVWLSETFPKARIFAVEPDAENARLCRLNCAGRANIEVVEAAIGSQPGRVTLARPDGQSWSIRTERAETGETPIVTIPQLKDRAGPDARLFIVKIDIEGFERDLFSASTDWVSDPTVIFLELHDWLFPGKFSSANAQRAMLAQNREMLISGENLVFIR